MDDDARLVERMRRGDEEALAALFVRHRTAVFRYAVHMAGRAAADDVVQDVFLAFLHQIGRYDHARGSVQAYLLGIARRQALKRLGAAALDDRGSADAEADAPDDGASSPLDALSRAETVERVRTAVGELPPPFREVVVLCELNELDYAAASEVIGCPIGTVRSRLHRARRMLRASLAAVREGAAGTHV